MGFIPQAQAQLGARLFGDQQIFINAPQYHWHVQGVAGADDKAKQHIADLAQRLHQFGHHIEEREMELWHRLSSAMDLPRVECLVAQNQEIWEAEYNKFVNELFVFVNEELSEFWRSM